MSEAHADDGSNEARDEYRRALRDYTQLMRHRLANPLTTIISGISTLREMPDLDPETRDSLLEMMAEHAAELERVALYPVAQGAEERDLVPLVDERMEGPERRQQLRERRKGMNEAQFRRINDLLAELSDSSRRDMIDFVCECSDSTCAATIQLTIDEYRDVHDGGFRFAVGPSHDDPTIEDVVAKSIDWWTVEKRGIAREQAEHMAAQDLQGDVDDAHVEDTERDGGSPPAAES